MFITVSKRQDNRYVFSVGEDINASSGSWIRSDDDAALLGDFPSSYATFGEAHAFASRLADDHSSCVLAKKISFYKMSDDVMGLSDNDGGEIDGNTTSAEDLTISHYIEQVGIVGQRALAVRTMTGKDAVDEANTLKKEMESIQQEMDKISPLIENDDNKKRFEDISKTIQSYLDFVNQLASVKKASNIPFSSSLPRTAIRAFSEAAMMGLEPRHKDTFIKSASFVPFSSTYEVVLANASEGDLVKLSFDRNLLLSDVIPHGASLRKCGGRGSTDFLIGYWEPIVSAVGHFHSKGNKVVAVASMTSNRRFCFSGFSMENNAKVAVVISNTKILGKESWLVKKASLETEPVKSPIPIGSEVVCVNPGLPTYNGRTGSVTEASEKPGRFEYRIDFRRGIGIVWLEDKDVRKVDIGR